jgi:hypothetical protein
MKISMPIEAALAMTEEGTVNRRWLEARIKLGDPGPVYVDGDSMWTDASEKEDADE